MITRGFLGWIGRGDVKAPRALSPDPAGRREEFQLSVVPRECRRAYNMRRIVEGLVDRGSFFEIGRASCRERV